MRIAPPLPRMAWWQSGYASDCKSAYAGSIPAQASKAFQGTTPLRGRERSVKTAPSRVVPPPRRFLFRSSSAVEQATVNRPVAGSIPASGATWGRSPTRAAPFCLWSLPPMNPSNEKVELVRRTVPFQGYFRVGTYLFRHSLFNGGQSKVISREVFETGMAAGVLPYDPARDEVLLIRQFRAGAYVAGRHPWTWELVAGRVESGETTEALVRREAVEEAGVE